jgi:NADH:ubiquinone oxidoreductase subunit 4 (subunit M)
MSSFRAFKAAAERKKRSKCSYFPGSYYSRKNIPLSYIVLRTVRFRLAIEMKVPILPIRRWIPGKCFGIPVKNMAADQEFVIYLYINRLKRHI